MKSIHSRQLVIWALFLSGFLLSCRQDMHDQPRYEPLEQNAFFGDKRASRQLLAGTVARGQLRLDEHLYKGTKGGELVSTFPFPVTEDVLKRGQERYNIFCAPCHDQTGSGHGMIVERGFRSPPSFHIDRLRQSPVGHFFDVISNGLGAMYDYSDRIPVRDRWAIVSYIRVLQLSQNIRVEDLSPEARQQLSQND